MKTRDRHYYTVERLSANQSLTKEGFLLCEGVAIARTGELLYGEGETPVAVGKDGIVRITRDASVVFHPDTLASFEGRPVTNDHPSEEVTPDNFREYVVGVVQNVRRGTGIDDELMLADLLIQDKEAILAVRDGKREVSCGYDADYEEIEPGRGRQLNIVGNHVALVESGRCGSRCSIQDRSMTMKKKAWKDRVRDAFKNKDEKELEAAFQDVENMEQGEGSSHHVHVHLNGDKPKDEEKPEGESAKKAEDNEAAEKAEGGSVEERLARIEALLEKLFSSEEEVEDESQEESEKKDTEEKMQDSKSVQDAAAKLEILVPGTKMPTLDSKDAKKARSTFDECRRKALEKAYEGEHRTVLMPLLGGVDLRAVSSATLDALFSGAAELVKAKNNAAGVRSAVTTKDFGRKVTPADINKRNAEFWASRH